MISAKNFTENLYQNGIEQAYGVPDSLLKELCLEIEDRVCPIENKTCINEGNAIAMAIGYHLIRKKLQQSTFKTG